MAANSKYFNKRFITGVCAVTSPPTTQKSGDPQVIGNIPGVVQADTDASSSPANQVTLDTQGAYQLSVQGVNSGGNVAVNNGDILYFKSANTPPLCKDTTGIRFGYAFDPTVAGAGQLIASGATATITVIVGY